MTTAKDAVFIGLQLKNCCLVGRLDFWWWGLRGERLILGGRGKLLGLEIFIGGRDEQIFGWCGGGGTHPPSPQ